MLPLRKEPPQPDRRQLPDYLPARMVNEFVYCPRLFFYEFVEGVFHDSADTIEGRAQHRNVDKPAQPLPAAEELQADEKIHSRSVTLSSDRLKVIAKMDLVQTDGAAVTPVDYKHGKPRETADGLELWPADRAQLAVQCLILRENLYYCDEGIAYYAQTKQRVRVVFTKELLWEVELAIRSAWELARVGVIPPPLVDSPKCPGCSLNGICLPDETNWVREHLAHEEDSAQMALLFEQGPPRKGPDRETRQLIAPRADRKPLYLNTQGLHVGKSGEVLQMRDRKQLVQEARINEICQVNLLGNVQISTQAIQELCTAGIPVTYFSMGGWFYGITQGMNTKNVFLRVAQYKLAAGEWFALSLSRTLTAAKIRNQRTLLQRNHIEPRKEWLAALKTFADRAEKASSLDELLGIEGNAARIYFGALSGMLKTDDPDQAEASAFTFDFNGRNRRPPRDPVNALLSLAYSLLTKDMTVACYAVGFDPLMGYYHQPRFGRPALALDLMEPFRPLIADSAVLSAINTRMVTPAHFVKAGPSVALTPEGRKAFFRAYELRMDSLVTHPNFDYRVSYRRLLEIQARFLAKLIMGEIDAYPVFVTR